MQAQQWPANADTTTTVGPHNMRPTMFIGSDQGPTGMVTNNSGMQWNLVGSKSTNDLSGNSTPPFNTGLEQPKMDQHELEIADIRTTSDIEKQYSVLRPPTLLTSDAEYTPINTHTASNALLQLSQMEEFQSVVSINL